MNKSIIKKSQLLMLVAMLCMTFGLHAQNDDIAAITFSGGDGRGATGSLSFSVGQIVQETSIARAITVVNITKSYTEGVQQPLTPRDNQRYEGIDPLAVNMSVYPNPATTHVIISCNQATEPLTYKLYSANGQLVQNGTYTTGEEIIRMENLPIGNYMLQVASSDNTKMNIYKIIKAK